MAWTEVRIELLKKLWQEGLSASQIAAKLGGVTRNAVIGKVHRLGLSGRAKTQITTPRARRPRKPKTTTVPPVKARKSTPPPSDKQPEIDAVVVPISKRATILTLTENTCKWPIGEPGEPDFHFCGCASERGESFCKYHAEIAYQPNANKRRAKKAS